MERIRKTSLLRSKRGDHYIALDFKGRSITDDLSNCFTFSCTNKQVLSENTKIPYHRLVYVFTKQGKVCLIENDHIIIKAEIHFKGRQIGGLRNPKLLIRRNNY